MTLPSLPIADSSRSPILPSSAWSFPEPPLVDRFGRVHRSMRISVTDRCNIRCFYCMPDESLRFRERSELLTFEEIARLAAVLAKAGVVRLRLTGGEPLVREGIPRLVELLRQIGAIEEIALTTNGMLLPSLARPLRDAGLDRINISLDTLDETRFRTISRRDGLGRVLEGIDAAIAAGFPSVRLNAVAVAGLTEPDVVPLVRFALERGLEMRFIEFMPLDGDRQWGSDRVLSGARIREILEPELGRLEPVDREDPARPASTWQLRDGRGTVGFIEPVSHPFCDACDRLRVTAEGRLRNCLFSTTEWEIKELLRQGATDAGLLAQVRDCVAAKKAAHGIDTAAFERPERAMYQIGG